MLINILFIIIMIVAIIIIAMQKELSKKVRGFVITMMILAVSFAVLFEYNTSKIAKDSRPITNAFKQGKVLTCKDNEINITTYSYEPGTSTFQPRLNVVGDTYSVKECAQK